MSADLTARQRLLIWQALTMVDPDTMNDNLAATELPDTTAQELDTIAAMFAPTDADTLDALGDFGPCECGKLGSHWVNNGRDTLPVCEECWRSEECLFTEALVEFNIALIGDGSEHNLAGLHYAALHDYIDPNQLLADKINPLLAERGIVLTWTEEVALYNRAAERYDEWFATR